MLLSFILMIGMQLNTDFGDRLVVFDIIIDTLNGINVINDKLYKS